MNEDEESFYAANQINDKNGLDYDWIGETVWCNPPYDGSIPDWIAKAQERRARTSALLLPASVDTNWYHDLIGERPRLWHSYSCEGFGHTWQKTFDNVAGIDLYIMRGRLRFLRDGVFGDQPRGSNLLAVFR